jgi:hypothetical protein
MALTINNAKKNFRAGKTFWRCMPLRGGTVDIEEVCLQGKLRTRLGSLQTAGMKKDEKRIFGLGHYYLNDLCGYGTAKTFDTRRKAERFKIEYECGLHPNIEACAQEHYE